jgi:hypothetical protein
MGEVEPLNRGNYAVRKEADNMAFILWLLAVALVIWGIVTLVRGQVLMGIVLIIVGLLVGPGGVSIFT